MLTASVSEPVALLREMECSQFLECITWTCAKPVLILMHWTAHSDYWQLTKAFMTGELEASVLKGVSQTCM